MAQQLINLIRDISTRMRQFREMADADDITERQARILQIVAQQGPMSVSSILSEYNRRTLAKLAASTISTSITNLFRDKKYVSKIIDPSNQRVTIVALTKKGREVLERVDRANAERLKTLVECFTITAEEEVLLEQVLSQLIVALDQRLQSERERRGISE